MTHRRWKRRSNKRRRQSGSRLWFLPVGRRRRSFVRRQSAAGPGRRDRRRSRVRRLLLVFEARFAIFRILVLRINAQDFVAVRDSEGKVALQLVDIAAIEITFCVVRLLLDDRVVIGNRLVVFLQVPKREGATIENRGITILIFQNDVVIFDCLFVVLLLQVGEGPETVGGDARQDST